MGNHLSDKKRRKPKSQFIEELDEYIPKEYIPPKMRAQSAILTADQIRDIWGELPEEYQDQPWTLSYSTNENGYSLSTMYRNLQAVEGAVLVVVKEFQGTVFGVLTSDPLRMSRSWFGTCESFLFSFKPDFHKYGPTFINPKCIYCAPDFLMFGGSSSAMWGLFLGEDFCAGSSFMCHTYANKPLAKNEDFLIRTVEVWSFRYVRVR